MNSPREQNADPLSVTITPLENGPYLISGPVNLLTQDGRELPQSTQVALCRCGHSKNKPFCDGTHRSIAFDGTLGLQG